MLKQILYSLPILLKNLWLWLIITKHQATASNKYAAKQKILVFSKLPLILRKLDGLFQEVIAITTLLDLTKALISPTLENQVSEAWEDWQKEQESLK